jgi:hypothetical protein
MKKSYYEFWAKRFIKDGLKAIKIVIGISIAFGIGDLVHIGLGILFFGFILVESLIDRN